MIAVAAPLAWDPTRRGQPPAPVACPRRWKASTRVGQGRGRGFSSPSPPCSRRTARARVQGAPLTVRWPRWPRVPRASRPANWALGQKGWCGARSRSARRLAARRAALRRFPQGGYFVARRHDWHLCCALPQRDSPLPRGESWAALAMCQCAAKSGSSRDLQGAAPSYEVRQALSCWNRPRRSASLRRAERPLRKRSRCWQRQPLQSRRRWALCSSGRGRCRPAWPAPEQRRHQRRRSSSRRYIGSASPLVVLFLGPLD